MVSTRGKVAGNDSKKERPVEFSAFESLLKRIVETPKESVNQAEREWEKSAARRRRKRRGRAEE